MIEIEKIFFDNHYYETENISNSIDKKLINCGFKYRACIKLNNNQFEIKNNKICINEEILLNKIKNIENIYSSFGKYIFNDIYIIGSFFIIIIIGGGAFMCYDWKGGLFEKFIIEGSGVYGSVNDWVIKGIIE